MKTKAIVMENEHLVSVSFESVLDLIEHVETGENAKKFNHYMNYKKSIKNWFGETNNNARDVINHALIGDSDLQKNVAEKMKQFRQSLKMDQINYTQKIKVIKRKTVYGDYGDELDIHKVYAGKLDSAWSRKIRIESDQEHNLVTLFINIGGLSNVKVDDSLWRTVVVTKIYEELESAGKSVKIIAGGTVVGALTDSRLCTYSIVIKDYNQSLSVGRLAAMSNVSFHRVFGFAARCAQNIAKITSMGFTTETNENDIPLDLQREIKKGHTKLVFIGKSISKTNAEKDLENVYRQLKSMTEKK